MGDLRDAFKKAGLIDDKTARRLQHEERVQKTELGREGLEEQRRREESERRRREEQKKSDAKAAQQEHDAAQKASERWKKLVRELDEQARRASSGPRRFHYREPDGHLPFLQIDDDAGRRLEAGEVAIVRLPGSEQAALAPRALALELRSLEPDRLLHLSN